MHESLNHWVRSHYTWDLTGYLYNYKNSNGRITIPTSAEGDDEDSTSKEEVESILTHSRETTSWLASSLDAVAVVDINICRPNFSPNNDDTDLHVAAAEIKTAVRRDSVARGTRLANPRMVVCEDFSDTFKKHVPKEHAAQIVHHCVALDMKWVL